MENACRQEAETLESWGDWLAGHGLSREISPSIALEAFAKISDCVAKIGEKERLEEKISRHRSSKDAYLASGGPSSPLWPKSLHPMRSFCQLLDRIAEEHDKSGNNRIARVGLERKIACLSEKISAQEKVLSGHRSQMTVSWLPPVSPERTSFAGEGDSSKKGSRSLPESPALRRA